MNDKLPLPIQIILTFCLTLALSYSHHLNAQSTCIDSSLIDPNALCPAIYDPVCGCDGITYGNSCEALTSGVTLWSPGVCSGNSACEGLNVNFLHFLITHSATVAFTDQSSMQNGQIVSWGWDFGDGILSSEPNPSHTYSLAGTYLVCLTVKAVDINGLVCEKTFCNLVEVPNDCFDNCLYNVSVEVDGVAMHASLTPTLQDTPFFFFVTWSLDGGVSTGSGLEFHPLLAEPGIHTVCATYPTGDFTAETCTVCKAFEVTSLCVDSAQIDLSVPCPLAFIPVCGCDGLTYDNACTAEHYGGVASWKPGICGSVCNNLTLDFDGFNSGGSLTVWTFNDKSYFPGGQITSWNWDFGNGQSSNEQNPTINFDVTGDYLVCLYASGLYADGTQCGGYICDSIHIPDQLCIDPNVIDLNVQCPAIYEPVCGCDGNIYENECVAYYHHGVTIWTPGVCPNTCINPAWIDTLAACIEIYDPVCGCDGQSYENECYAITHGVTSWEKGLCCTPHNCQAFFTVKKLSNNSVLITNLSVNAGAWSLDMGDGHTFLGYFDTFTYTYSESAAYQICLGITGLDGVCTDQYCVLIDFNTIGVSDAMVDFKVTVQPNPTSDLATIIVIGATLERAIIMDVYGKVVLEQVVSGAEAKISTGRLPSGIYFLNVRTDKGILSRKIAVQR